MRSRTKSFTSPMEENDNVPDYEVVNIHHRRQKRDTDTSSTHQIALEAFGKRFELELNRNLNLVPEKKRLNVFFADRGREDEIQYNPTNLEDDDGDTDDVGEVFQDETNMAA